MVFSLLILVIATHLSSLKYGYRFCMYVYQCNRLRQTFTYKYIHLITIPNKQMHFIGCFLTKPPYFSRTDRDD